MLYFFYAIVYLGSSLVVLALNMALELNGVSPSPGAFVGFVPIMVAAMMAGMRFARLNRRMPRSGESWGFSLGATVIVLIFSGLTLWAVYSLGDPEIMAQIQTVFEAGATGTLLIILAVVNVLTLLLNRALFSKGAKRVMKTLPAQSKAGAGLTSGYMPGGTASLRKPIAPTQPTYFVRGETRLFFDETQFDDDEAQADGDATGTEPVPSSLNARTSARMPYLYFLLWFIVLTIAGLMVQRKIEWVERMNLPVLLVLILAIVLAALSAGLHFPKVNRRRATSGETLRFALISTLIVMLVNGALFWGVLIAPAMQGGAMDEMAIMLQQLTPFIVVVWLVVAALILILANGIVFSLGTKLRLLPRSWEHLSS